MMVEKILKISLSSLMILLLSSCSIAGSWVYERLDSYLADYFKEYADFSKEQNQEIELISEEFLNWFSENELLKIKLLIEDLKKIDLKNPEERVASAYRQGEEIFRKVNDFFEVKTVKLMPNRSTSVYGPKVAFICLLPYQKAVNKALNRAFNKALSFNKSTLLVMKVPY